MIDQSYPSSDKFRAYHALIQFWDQAGLDIENDLKPAQFITQKSRARSINTSDVKVSNQTGFAKAESNNVNPSTKFAKRPIDPFEDAKSRADSSHSLAMLRQNLLGFDGCPLKSGARNTVFADGVADAKIMIIGEGPGRDEDIKGLPFVGRSGQLLDKMFAAIGFSRTKNLYITNVNFWRPPGNRNPNSEELALCRPFVERHIALIAPKLIIATGGIAAKTLLETDTGIMRLRGQRYEYHHPSGQTIPLIPIMHPAYLLRRPQDKAQAWADLLLIEDMAAEFGLTKTDRL